MTYKLLDKTEIRIAPVKINNVSLGEIAQVAARVLGLPEDRVMVIDAQEDCIALDILQQDIEAGQIAGKGEELLAQLSRVNGLEINCNTHIHSDGILCVINLEPDKAMEVLQKTDGIVAEIKSRANKRVKVFPSGSEVQSGMIIDTNTPFLIEQFKNEGLNAVAGEIIPDNKGIAVRMISAAVSEGYGLIITTGGVGAEHKDNNIEALLQVAPDAVTPYIIKFSKGQGRHIKDGVRIGVGVSGLSTIIALPGPHDEVRACFPVLRSYIRGDINIKMLPYMLAEVLKKRWQNCH